jgi:RHS repeat-associated protein
MTSQTKAIIWQIEAKPFGETLSLTGSALLNLRFPGQYFDAETGLNQNWFRDYMPKVGRYAEPDPIGLSNPDLAALLTRTSERLTLLREMQEDPIYGTPWETYPYARGNALKREDRSGLIGQSAVGVGIMYYYYRQMRQKNWEGGDKYYHCMASCKASWVGHDVAMNLGIAREVSDWLRKGEWDPDDWKANSRGLSCPLFQRCEDRCKPLAPPGML